MRLTEFGVKSAKLREKPYKLADGGGLYLLIQPTGSKLWRLKYRFAKKEKTLSFGSYPVIGIADARAKRDDAKRLLLDNIDPSAKRAQEKAIAETEANTTFGLIAEEYLERMRERDAAIATINKTQPAAEVVAKWTGKAAKLR